MEFLVIALIVCASVRKTWCVSEDEKQMLVEMHNACLVESGVSPEFVQKVMNEEELIDDVKHKEHLVCVAKKLGVISESGDLMEETVKQKVHAYIGDEAKADEIISKCVVKMDTPQDTVFNIGKCAFEMIKM